MVSCCRRPVLAALLSTLSWFLLFAAALRVSSPVLRTLTVAYSDDTIYALTFILFAVSRHMLCNIIYIYIYIYIYMCVYIYMHVGIYVLNYTVAHTASTLSSSG
jgi:hypothetical protein